jgi:hypothetical protein
MALSATRLVDWQGLKDLACAGLFLHFHNGQVIAHSVCMAARGKQIRFEKCIPMVAEESSAFWWYKYHH